MLMPWECFVCMSWRHDCGHREAPIVEHVLGDAPKLEQEAKFQDKLKRIRKAEAKAAAMAEVETETK